jgi:hypothetical protein
MNLLTRLPPRSLILILCAVLAPLLFVGCAEKGAERYRLAGKITWKGKPIPAGIIYFDPDLSSGQDGPQGHATITNGEYDTAKEGLGPGSGKYSFRLYAFNGVPGVEAPMGQPLFPEYTWIETLPAGDSEKNIEVPATVANGL